MILVLESLTYMIGIGGRRVGTEVKLMRLFLTFLNYKECYKNCAAWVGVKSAAMFDNQCSQVLDL